MKLIGKTDSPRNVNHALLDMKQEVNVNVFKPTSTAACGDLRVGLEGNHQPKAENSLDEVPESTAMYPC